MDEKCYEEPSLLTLVAGIVLISIGFVAFGVQYANIIRKKSSDGINYIMLSLKLVCASLSTTNSVLLSWPKMKCCFELTPWQCVKNNLGTEQLLFGATMIWFLYLLFLIFYRTESNATQTQTQRKRQKLFSLILFFVLTFLTLLLTVVGMIIYHKTDRAVTVAYAMTLGILAAIGVLFQWAPQIYTTYKLKSPGSLSITSLLLLFPGILLILYFQVSLGANWTTWGPFIVELIQQLILTVMCIVYAIRERRNDRKQLLEEEQPFIKDHEMDK